MAPATEPASRGALKLGVHLVDQAIVSGSSFLVTLLLVRALGLSIYGAFAMVSTMGIFVVSLQLAFVSQPMMSVAPKLDGAARREYLGAALAIQGLFTAVVVIVTSAAYLALQRIWGDTVLDGTLGAGVTMIAALQLYYFVRNYFFATGRVWRAALNDGLVFLSQFVVLYVLARRGELDLNAVFWAIGAVFLAGTAIGLIQYESVRLSRVSFTRALGRNWRFGRWLGAMSVFQWFSANTFLVAAGAILGSGAVGALKAARDVIGVLHVLFAAVENFVPVDAARRLARDGLHAMVESLRRVLVMGLAGTAVVGACLTAWARPILEALYGGRVDRATIEALEAFALLYVLGFAASILGIAFRSIERTRGLAMWTILAALPMIVFAHPLVARFGLAGAVYGMVAQKALLVLCLGAHFAITTRRRRALEAHSAA